MRIGAGLARGIACHLGWSLSLLASIGGSAQGAAPVVDEGQAAYVKNCALCHGAGLNDGPFGNPLLGEAFHAKWSQDPNGLLALITTTMPPTGIGTLSPQTYAAITQYIASKNGMPSPAQAVAAGTGQQASQRPETPTAPGPAVTPRTPPAPPRDAFYNSVISQRQAKLQKISPVSTEMLSQPPVGDWLIWRRTYDGLGFSPLDKVNRRNVASLVSAWNWSLPISQNEITPLVHDGVIFLESGTTVQALDAVTGDLLWQYIRPVSEELDNGRRWRIKSLAIFGHSLFVPTIDGHMVALDTRTGKVVWDQNIAGTEGDRRGGPESVGLLLTGGPIVADGKVIVGFALSQRTGGTRVIALDATTGTEVWRFYTVARPGEPGGDTWNGRPLEQRFGAGVWTPATYDPKLQLIYFGTGNTYNTASLIEPYPGSTGNNDGLYTNSTLALDVHTGKLAWHFQHVNREVWDLDWSFERSLVTVPVDGKPIEAVITGGKIALFDVMDRITGKYLFSVDMGLQNLVIGIDPVTGKKSINPELEPKAGKTTLMCPNTLGARNWPATAFNPSTSMLYVPMTETCADYTYSPRSEEETAKGGSDIRTTRRARPDSDGLSARLAAVDLVQRKIVWTKRQRAPFSSAILATGGGIVFSGTRDRMFRALDEKTGAMLWETRLNSTPSSFPITYSVNGEQYVAVVAGGGGPTDSNGAGIAPEIENPAEGITLSVFKLPGRPSK